jgi:biotin carboxyl carrier protein
MARIANYFARNLSDGQTDQTKVEVEGLGEGRYAVTMDGHRFEVDSLELQHGAVSLLVENESYSVEFDEKADEVKVFLRGQVTNFDIVDERRLRVRQMTAFDHVGKQVICAPMPGKVVKVFVKVGDVVAEGQGLVVVEAMKMENELKAHKAGTVTEVMAKEGTPVENGAPLVVVE